MNTVNQQLKNKQHPRLINLLKPYKKSIGGLVFLAITSSSMGLIFPKIIAQNIDAYIGKTFNLNLLIFEFSLIALGIFSFTYAQNILQVYTSEKVAKDLRKSIADKISRQSYAFVEKISAAKLLTNLTADVDAIKVFIAQAIVSLVSSLIIVIGASILLFTINWKLALAVLAIVPLIGTFFYFVFSKVKELMKRRSEVVDWLNKVINESILGSALIRVLNSEQPEYEKFFDANINAQNVGLQILRKFASMMPIITFIANMAALIILTVGGYFVIGDTMTLGEFTAFNGYVALLIFPILIIGMMTNAIAQASASYERIDEVLQSEELVESGKTITQLKGSVELQNISLQYGEKSVLKNVSFAVKAKSRTAIIGPTSAGKTLLLYLLIGLIEPTEGTVLYDNHPMNSYDKESLHKQVGFVFQDSIIFNLSLRENIAFSDEVQDADLLKALETAELKDFVDTLSEGLNTIISERGESLSGGQKQRIMLARALALNPKILLLDDFTARVDSKTEKNILNNIIKNYPDITLLSVTQKISSIETYDQIVVMMEGERIATGTHQELLKSSPEYIQIYNSQKSTNHYE